MAQLTDSKCIDLVKTTQRWFKPGRFEQLGTDLQSYPVMQQWFEKSRIQVGSGRGIQKNMQVRTGDSASHAGKTDKEEVNIVDVMEQLTVDWVRAKTYWLYDRQDLLMNKGRSAISDMVEAKRAGAYIDLVQELELRGWAAPVPGNEILPWGIRYWIVSNATQGFNGGAPSGFTTVGGINPTTITKHRNYTDRYVDVTRGDLIARMLRAKNETNWRSPTSKIQFRDPAKNKFRIYMRYDDCYDLFVQRMEEQNDNLGADAARYDGQVTFAKHSVEVVPSLASDDTCPVFGVDFSTFYPCVLRGDYLRESEPAVHKDNHNWFIVWVDLTYQYICLNRRRNWLIDKAA